MKKKTVSIISIILVFVIALSLFAFARGRGGNFVKIQLDSNTYKKIEPSIKNLYDSLKSLINKEVTAGIISKYYAENIIKNLDEAYSQINKTKTIYLPLFADLGFGPKGPRANPPMNNPQNQGPAGNQQGQNPSQGQGYGQGFGPGFGFNTGKLTDTQIQAIKSITPEVLKVIDAELNLAKALKDAGILTDLQYSSYIQRLDIVKQATTNFPLIHYGLIQFFKLAGFEPKL